MSERRACASSCKEGGHATYGECLRAKRLTTLAGETTRASFPPKEPHVPHRP